MAVKFDVENYTRSDVFLFDPADIIIIPHLNGRYEALTPEEEADMESLISSIVDKGQLEPAIVRIDGGKPVLVAGFRRYQAVCQINDRKLLPEGKRMKLECIRRRCNEQEGFLLNYEENHKRRQTSAMDDAHHFAQLEKWNMTVEEIADRLHLKVAFVRDRLALIETIPALQKAVASGKVKPTAATRLAKLSTQAQKDFMAAQSNGHKVSVKDVDAATGKVSKPSLKAVREYIDRFDGPGEEDNVREVVRQIIAFIDGKA